MDLSKSVKPISYLKAHASEMIREVCEDQASYVITQNGEAKAILQDLRSYEEMQQSIAMLKILAISTKDREEGRYQSVEDAFADIRKEIEREEG